MANAYYDYNNGNSGNSGLTAALAKATRGQAVAVAGAGDKVIAVDGNQVHESGPFLFNDDRIEQSETYRGSTLQANSAEVTRVARTSALSASNNPWEVDGIVFDGESGNSGSGVQGAFELFRQSTVQMEYVLKNCHFITGSLYGLKHDQRRGRTTIVNAKFTGDLVTNIIMLGLGGSSSANLAQDGDQDIDVQGAEFLPNTVTGSVGAIVLQQETDGVTANTLNCSFKGLTGVIPVAASATMTFADIRANGDIIFSGFDLTIEADDAATNIVGFSVRGRDAGEETDNASITNGTLRFNAPAGHGISFGSTAGLSLITNGLVSGNHVIGKYYPDKSPHNISMRNAITGTCSGNISQNSYVGYLMSSCLAVTVNANLAFDCYGSSYYVKGTTAATIANNVAVVTTTNVQRGLGILAVSPDVTGEGDTAGATFKENLVIVVDIDGIHSLGYIEDSDQICTFSNNTYIISDTVDLTSKDLFSYENGAGGAANNTIAEWNAQSEVTNDRIVQVPDSVLAAIANSFRPVTGGGGLALTFPLTFDLTG